MPWEPQNRIDGIIDVSHNNGKIDWSRVPTTITLVFVKATQGTGFTDPELAANITGCRATNRRIVPYHFLTEDDVAAQLNRFTTAAALGTGTPAMVDWEIDPKRNRRPSIATMEAFLAGLLAVVGKREKIVPYHGMYDLSSPAINAYPWFVPKYGPEPRGPRWLLWQYSPAGRVAGIPNPVDVSWFAGTENELQTWYRDGTLPAGFADQAEPQPPAAPVSDVPGAVRELQNALQLGGYDPGPIDGVPGQRTIAALQRYAKVVTA